MIILVIFELFKLDKHYKKLQKVLIVKLFLILINEQFSDSGFISVQLTIKRRFFYFFCLLKQLIDNIE